MKMYYQTSQRPRKGKYAALAALVFGIVLLSFVLQDVPHVVTNVAHTIATPVWEISRMVSGGDDNDEKVRTLEETVAKLERALVAERVQRADDGVLSGRILTNRSVVPQDVFVLDRGEDVGVRSGALITDRAGNAVGYVTRVLQRTSIGYWFSSPRAETAVVVQASSTLHAQATGKGNGTLAIELPRDVEVREGDPVYLPGAGQIALGTVSYQELLPEAAERDVLVRMNATLLSTNEVSIFQTVIWSVDTETQHVLLDQEFTETTKRE
jgi:hypothetical protein